MDYNETNDKKINEIFTRVLTAMEESKKETFDIVEGVGHEYNSLQTQIEIIKENVRQLIQEVDELEMLEKNSRKELAQVSKNFTIYNEEDIRKAYEEANILQIQLSLKRQHEKELIQKRTETEIRLKSTEKTLKKAENLTSKISIVQEFLSETLQDIHNAMEDIKHKHIIGRKIIQTQEEERKRIARDIHDGPAQSLANLVIKSEVCERLLDIDKEKTREEIRELKRCIRESIKEIRKIIYNLRPTAIDDLGLIPSLQRYIENFEKDTNIPVDFNILSQADLTDPIKMLSVFRIIQEALNNIIKHADANIVKINVTINAKDIIIYIKDDGVGFNLEEVSSQFREYGGLGLINIEERVNLLNGSILIKSEINRGTLIKATIPMKNKGIEVELNE